MLSIDLGAVVTTLDGDNPQVLVVPHAPLPCAGQRGGEDAEQDGPAGTSASLKTARHRLPNGPFVPGQHRTLEVGLRSFVHDQTGLELGFVEQLYTFADRGRHTEPGDTGTHVVSVGYVSLARRGGDDAHGQAHGSYNSLTAPPATDASAGHWINWYRLFPWEDWRNGRPEIIDRDIVPKLQDWVQDPDRPARKGRSLSAPERLRTFFGVDGASWDGERVLERFELLYEAGLVHEALADGRDAAQRWPALPQLGQPLAFDHRRILATAMGRLRAKIKYRPVIFEVMAPDFTLFELQRAMEALLGHGVHKQNFRRLVETGGLVEPTGEIRARTGGRPAKLYRFRRDVLLERPSPGVRVNSLIGNVSV
ncbi:MAG: NAD regulator [Pseudomonadota bacterium]